MRSRPGRLAPLLCVIGVLTGCGLGQPAPGSPPGSSGWAAQPYPSSRPTGSPAGVLPLPDPSVDASPDTTALAGVRALRSIDTTVDSSPHAAALRARAWLTPAFAAAVAQYPPVAAPGAQWTQWTLHRAYATVTTTLLTDDRPVDRADYATRQVVAAVQVLGRDGWSAPSESVVVFVSLQRIDGHWRIAGTQTT